MTNDKSPFLYRPWMLNNCAGAAAGGENKGIRGVIAGGITGGIEICITFPTEFVKTQLQLDEKGDRKKYDGIIDCVKKTVREKGFFGLYRGLSVLVVGSIPKAAVRFGTFETLKSHLKNEDGSITTGRSLLCGLGAGVNEAILAVTPMETIKVKFIHDQRRPDPQYRGLFHGVYTIVRTDGFGGIYKGVVATILRQGTNQMMRFGVMETCKRWYTEGDPSKKIPKIFIGCFGFFAGFVSVIANTPLDVVKTRMQGLESHLYKNTLDCARQIFVNEGAYAFYKGTIPRLGRVCLDVALTFMIYESFLDLFKRIFP